MKGPARTSRYMRAIGDDAMYPAPPVARIAEHVAVAVDHLAGVDPDAEAHATPVGLMGGVVGDSLLHRNRARHGATGRGELHQEAVTEVLHGPPAVGVELGAYRLLVAVEELARFFVADAREQVGRPLEIREQDRDRPVELFHPTP